MFFVTFILKNVVRRPVRSILTGMGVALAVGAVVALVGISYGLEESFVQMLETRGVDLVVVRAGVADAMNSVLDENIGRRLGEISGVEQVARGLMETMNFPQANNITVLVQGWTADSFLFKDLTVLSGRRLQPADRHAVMLGTFLAQNLGKKTGDSVEIEMQKFEVVGVYQSFNVFENGSAVMLLGDLQRLMDRTGQVNGFQIVVANIPNKKQAIERICRQIEELHDEQGNPLRLRALAAREHVENAPQIRQARGMAWLTSAIALVIGTVGMLNTMIMSVFERTREIGILRAIGWHKSRILCMILGESLVLCLAGAVLGTIGAVGVTRLLSTFPQARGFVQGTVPLVVVGQGFVIAVLVGLVGGAYPAYRGASLSPTEAIRHE